MYFPPNVPKKRAFWGFVRIAFIVAAVVLWCDEHSKVQQLLAKSSTSVQVNVPQQAPPQIQVNLPPQVSSFPPEQAFFGPDGAPGIGNYSFGKYVAVSSNCKNFSQSVPAEDAMCWMRAFFVDTKLNSQKQAVVSEAVQDDKFSQFEKEKKSLKNDQRLLWHRDNLALERRPPDFLIPR